MLKTLILSFIALMVGRVLIPVIPTPLDAHTWYDKISHMWVGAMLTIMFLRSVDRDMKIVAGLLLAVASLIELIFFLAAK